MLNKRKPAVLTFVFFNDEKGRLRATCKEFGRTRPVESVQGKRYKFPKLFGMQRWFGPEDLVRLHTAVAGDQIQVEM